MFRSSTSDIFKELEEFQPLEGDELGFPASQYPASVFDSFFDLNAKFISDGFEVEADSLQQEGFEFPPPVVLEQQLFDANLLAIQDVDFTENVFTEPCDALFPAYDEVVDPLSIEEPLVDVVPDQHEAEIMLAEPAKKRRAPHHVVHSDDGRRLSDQVDSLTGELVDPDHMDPKRKAIRLQNFVKRDYRFVEGNQSLTIDQKRHLKHKDGVLYYEGREVFWNHKHHKDHMVQHQDRFFKPVASVQSGSGPLRLVIKFKK